MNVEKQVVELLNEKRCSMTEYKHFEIRREVLFVMHRLIDLVETPESKKTRMIQAPVQNVHASWEFRAMIIAFWIHPWLGGKNFNQAGYVFSVNPHTLRTWVSQKKT